MNQRPNGAWVRVLLLGMLSATAQATTGSAPGPASSAPDLSRSGLAIPVAPVMKKKRAVAPRRPTLYHAEETSDKAQHFYPAAWGVTNLKVSYTASGNLIRFSFRVLEPKLAKALGDREATPYLFAPRSHAMLQVPNMEQVGQLRQLGALVAHQDYWMVFSNKGDLVRPGERVSVIIGRFHADDLLVE